MVVHPATLDVMQTHSNPNPNQLEQITHLLKANQNFRLLTTNQNVATRVVCKHIGDRSLKLKIFNARGVCTPGVYE